jgi:DtxR family Mn-dependent transcriptional regulator
LINPLADLLIVAALLAALLILFWPDRGAFWALRRMVRVSDRVLIEDALKHLHDAQYRGQTASVESLAGALAISSNQSADLLARIEARGLMARDGVSLRLTPDGIAYALRIIRVHRLWERYLAEETGVSEVDWHTEAEKQEHSLSPEEVEALAARMGHPRYDPHGDPIPTAAGDLPPWQGVPLTSLAPGKLGTIVHLEDEPSEIYSQLVAEGLNPGMRVEVFEVSSERVCLWADDGEEHVLAPVVAANVSVLPLPEDSTMDGPFETLASLEPGEAGRVLHIAQSCRGLQRRRLMDLGIVPGTEVAAEMTSSAGDPTAYRIRGSLIALRDEQAKQVQITRALETS